MIKYKIVRSHLVLHPTGFSARVVSTAPATFEQVVDRVAKGHTTVSKSDVLSVLEDYHEVIEEFVADGKTVATPHVLYRASIRGVFADPADGFDPARHRVLVRISPGPRLRRALRDVPVDRQPADTPRPRPESILDVVSGAKNSTLTPGGAAQLLGSDLRYDPADPQQGVFFLDTAGNTTRADSLILNRPSLLIFHIPTLPAGEYKLEVRAIMYNNNEVRYGPLDAVLTVA